MSRLRYLWRRQPYVLSAFLLTAAVAVFFAARFLTMAIYWQSHREEPIRGWMTVGYISRSWGLDGPTLDALAGLPGPRVKGHPQSLREIARDRGIPEATLIAEVEKAVATLRRAEPQQ